MRDVRSDLAGLWRLASALEPSSGGRVIQFIGAHAGEGVSSVAVSFAQIAAQRAARMTWLIDLDLQKNPLYTAFSKGIIRDAGRPLHPLDASLGAEQIYTVPGHEQDVSFSRMLNAHQIEGQRLLVTRFRSDRLAPGQRVRLRPSPGWWRALRKAAEWIVVDAPPIDRSKAGLAFVSQADGVVLVARADATPAADVAGLRQEVEARGGRVLGVVLNQIQADASLLSRFDGRG